MEIVYAGWEFFRESAIYMMFGFLIAGVVSAWIRAETINRYLGNGKVKPVVLSALIGIPIPLCSCGVVPAAASLKSKGANKGATLAFLIATPESGVDSIAVTYALMDPVMTVVRPVAAFLTAMTAGIAENLAGRTVAVEGASTPTAGCGCTDGCNASASTLPVSDAKPETRLQRLAAGIRYAYVDLLSDIGRWFLIGVLLAALITVLVPNDWINALSHQPMAAMAVMLVAGIPMYVCATASTPIAAALILKGLNPGAALVFLLVGPATNMASMSMVAGLLGRRTLGIYLASIAICSLVLGATVDWIYAAFAIEAHAIVGQAAHLLPPALETAAAVLFAVILAAVLLKPYLNRLRKPRPADCPDCAG